MENLNLCAVMIEEMVKLEFKQESIAAIQNTAQFINAYNQPETLQRTALTLVISRIFAMGEYVVPAQIRLALNISTDTRGWTDDLKLVLLPFLKMNEPYFFV